MNPRIPDPDSLQRFAAELAAGAPRPHHSGLLAAAARLGHDFRHALTRGSWYRPGGLIRADGTRIADDLERWAEDALAACGGDFAELCERHAGADLLATRHNGRTHYFVAPCGPGPADFVQLEVEELQEVLDRRLIDPLHLPADLGELTDPLHPHALPAQPVGRPRYRFRRLLDMRDLAAPGATGPGPLQRFLADWQASRAAGQGHFCAHWILSVRERRDRYGNAVTAATPVSRHARKLKSFHWHPDARGVALAGQVHAFDRASYPSAWYFHLMSGALTPTAVAYGMLSDLDAGYQYLAAQDVELLRGWAAAPYAV
ncbi:MAG: hypothetical protein PHS77_04620 [Gallionellaceae bacterium]|nr:hypothetical protein [Gallionellaceae bacterium]